MTALRKPLSTRGAAGILAVGLVGIVGAIWLSVSDSPPDPSTIRASPAAFATARPTPLAVGPTPDWTDTSIWSWLPFTSDRHGYSARHPSGWGVQLASAPASPAILAGDSRSSDVWDVIRLPGLEIIALSSDVPVDLERSGWIASYADFLAGPDGPGSACLPPATRRDEISIDQQTGTIYDSDCGYSESITFVGPRAYVFRAFDPVLSGATEVSRAVLGAFLGTVTFDPVAADDSPAEIPAAPLDSSDWLSFVSPLHGFAAKRPAGWHVEVASTTDSWDRIAPQASGPGGGLAVYGRSEAVPVSLTPDGWIRAHRSIDGQIVCRSSGHQPTIVDGEGGTFYKDRCGVQFFEARFFVGGRVYVFKALDESVFAGPIEGARFGATAEARQLLLAFLANVTFDPSVTRD